MLRHGGMKSTWASVIERADDPNLGATLIRLAGLAVAAHRFKDAQWLAGPRHASLEYRGLQDRAEELSLEPVARCCHQSLSMGPVYTEVDR